MATIFVLQEAEQALQRLKNMRRQRLFLLEAYDNNLLDSI